ncbi:MAG: restriction endonuclease subunit R [Chloroflexota bacterium]
MATKIQARNASLDILETDFGLQMIERPDFFPEWQVALPEINDMEKQALDKIRAGYFHQVKHPPIIEDTIKLAVLSPLLYFADYFLQPLIVKSETPITLSSEDDEIVMEGKIDVLVLTGNFWLMVIESKRPAYSLEAGLAQMLTYMLTSPNLKEGHPTYGMITNGGDFVFIKVAQSADGLGYATSRAFVLRNPGNDLYPVLQILKRLGTLLFKSTE